jgi:hypothetical protein
MTAILSVASSAFRTNAHAYENQAMLGNGRGIKYLRRALKIGRQIAKEKYNRKDNMSKMGTLYRRSRM